MHDEASRRRLEEMGIDVYLPRKSGGVEVPSSSAARMSAPAEPASGAHAPATTAPSTKSVETASLRDADVLLLADATGASAESLLSAVARTLAFARVTSVRASADDAGALATARALVAFGEVHARAAGAALSAQRQSQIGWVVAAETTRLRGDALAKRALWGELKRIVRLLRV